MGVFCSKDDAVPDVVPNECQYNTRYYSEKYVRYKRINKEKINYYTLFDDIKIFIENEIIDNCSENEIDKINEKELLYSIYSCVEYIKQYFR